ncbi:MAG: endonuclease III [Candidatus Omnitrophota bacterium]
MLSKNVKKIIDLLKENYAGVKIALKFKTPFQLLIATILSAQCTDERVNKVTPALFDKYKDAESLAGAGIETIEKIIKPTGFYKNKARSLKGSAEAVMKNFGGKVPSEMTDLISLPGVARKTANVVLFNAFGKNEGIAVDTHVKRLSRRFGWTTQDNPDKIEKDLTREVEKEDWGVLTLLLMSHGRAVCAARQPKCGECFLNKLCPSAFKIK